MDTQNPFQQNLSELQNTAPANKGEPAAPANPKFELPNLSSDPGSTVKTSGKTPNPLEPTIAVGTLPVLVSPPKPFPKKFIAIGLGILAVAAISFATIYIKAGPSTQGALNNAALTQEAKKAPPQTQTEIVTSQATTDCHQIAKNLGNLLQIHSLATDPAIRQDLQTKIDQQKKLAFEQECPLVLGDSSANPSLNCAPGQMADQINNRCICDKQNGYYPVTIENAFVTSISTTPSSLICMSCNQITERLDEIAKSSDSTVPVSLTSQTSDEKNLLTEAAQQNNCNLCGGFDEKIKNTLAQHQWTDYYQTVNAKLDDKICGKNLSSCDSSKWKLIFTLQLKKTLNQDPSKNQTQLANLELKIKELRSNILQNTCVDFEQACRELLTATASSEIPAETALAEIDLETITPGQLFEEDRAFKAVHCRTVQTKGVKRPNAPKF